MAAPIFLCQCLPDAVTADAHVLRNAALRPAITPQPLGALLGALGCPQQNDDGQQQQDCDEGECCCHGVNAVGMMPGLDAAPGRPRESGWKCAIFD